MCFTVSRVKIFSSLTFISVFMCTIEYQENEIIEPHEVFQESQLVSRALT